MFADEERNSKVETNPIVLAEVEKVLRGIEVLISLESIEICARRDVQRE